MENQVVHTLYDYIRDFSSPFMYLIQNVILAITAIYALKSIKSSEKNTVNQINNQESISKKRATLDLILNMTADVKYNESRSVVLRLQRDQINPASLRSSLKDIKLSEEERKKAADQHRACQYLLNRFALFSSGIQIGVLDEETFKIYYYSSFMIYVDFLRPYIMDLRDTASPEIQNKAYVSHETLYQEIVWLFNKWKSEPLKKEGSGSV